MSGLPPSAAAAAKRILGGVNTTFIPSFQACRQAKLSSRALGCMAGNLWVKTGEGRDDRVDIGLAVKNGAKGLCVPEFCRPAHSGMGWMYRCVFSTPLQIFFGSLEHSRAFASLSRDGWILQRGRGAVQAVRVLQPWMQSQHPTCVSSVDFFAALPSLRCCTNTTAASPGSQGCCTNPPRPATMTSRTYSLIRRPGHRSLDPVQLCLPPSLAQCPGLKCVNHLSLDFPVLGYSPLGHSGGTSQRGPELAQVPPGRKPTTCAGDYTGGRAVAYCDLAWGRAV